MLDQFKAERSAAARATLAILFTAEREEMMAAELPAFLLTIIDDLTLELQRHTCGESRAPSAMLWNTAAVYYHDFVSRLEAQGKGYHPDDINEDLPLFSEDEMKEVRAVTRVCRRLMGEERFWAIFSSASKMPSVTEDSVSAEDLHLALKDLMQYVGGWDEKPGHPCHMAAELLARVEKNGLEK